MHTVTKWVGANLSRHLVPQCHVFFKNLRRGGHGGDGRNGCDLTQTRACLKAHSLRALQTCIFCFCRAKKRDIEQFKGNRPVVEVGVKFTMPCYL